MSAQTQTQSLEQLITGGFDRIEGRLDNVEGRLDKMDQRVSELEQAGPVLKTRIVSQPAAVPPSMPAPVPPKPVAIPRQNIVPRYDDDEGEDEAIADGRWAKEIKRTRCHRCSLTKTRKRDAWKIVMSMPGQRRPATFIGWDGEEQILTFFADVLPDLNADDFDEGTWRKKDKGSERVPILKQWDCNFIVEWFQTSPNAQGQTFVNIETVYPIDPED